VREGHTIAVRTKLTTIRFNSFQTMVAPAHLDPQQHLFYCNRRSPSFLFVQNTQTNSPTRVNIRMKERWNKLAFGGFGWVFLTEFKSDFVDTPFPVCAWFAGDASFPLHHVRRSVSFRDRTSVETKRMVTAPCLPLLHKATTSNTA